MKRKWSWRKKGEGIKKKKKKKKRWEKIFKMGEKRKVKERNLKNEKKKKEKNTRLLKRDILDWLIDFIRVYFENWRWG